MFVGIQATKMQYARQENQRGVLYHTAGLGSDSVNTSLEGDSSEPISSASQESQTVKSNSTSFVATSMTPSPKETPSDKRRIRPQSSPRVINAHAKAEGSKHDPVCVVSRQAAGKSRGEQ